MVGVLQADAGCLDVFQKRDDYGDYRDCGDYRDYGDYVSRNK